MKKREQVKRKDNVIFFPGVEKRLTAKGLDSLQARKYSEAIALLEEAMELDPDNDEILIGLVLAYFEAAAYQKAKVLAKDMLLKGIGDYYKMVDLYLTVLIQLHEYQEIVTTIEALLEEKEIIPEKLSHFMNILQFSRKMAENHQPSADGPEQDEPGPQSLNLLKLTDLNEQMLLVSSLADKNIRPYVSEMEEYLKTETGHPLLKTVLLTLLKEQEIDSDMVVRKFNQEKQVKPALLLDARMIPEMLAVKDLVAESLENKDPVLFGNIIALVERIYFISYPFDLEPNNLTAWAAAFILLGFEYLGIEAEIQEIAEEFEALPAEINQAMEQIIELEKISYPNI
ncbi:tetratricopeptide repeat protein [Neobacillus dielmonensis]|uniref:tetratricopeptide repeat protein n=1 Tax=Neobacillus dielmonensis TaxID=1347369 RepID=UPI0005AA31EA|nr:tetratricopeptide repeat protein [Neobacillus dielmonensis]